MKPAADRVQSPPPELSLVAFQGDFCFSFMFSNFIWRSYGSLWLNQAAEGKLGHLAFDATKALSQANFGRTNHKTDIELEGSVQYGKCLTTLATELGKGTALVKDGNQLLIPILILLMHAASKCDRTGAIFHLRGLSRLLYICGPEAFQRQPLLNAFEAARATVLVTGLVGKQRLFFDDERWRTVPWALDPKSKTPQSEILDILVVVPGILQDHAAWEQSTAPDPASLQEIIKRVEKQLVALYEWRWRWQSTSGHHVGVDEAEKQPPNGPAFASLGPIGSSRKFGRLRFAKFVAATELMLYNAALMWLLALLWKLDPFGAGPRIESCAVAATPQGSEAWEISFDPLRRPGSSLTVRDPAMEVCRSFEWVSRHHQRSKEPTFLYLFPVGMAMNVLELEPEGKTWVKSLLDKNPITANYAQGENPAGFGFYITSQSLNTEKVQADEQIFPPHEVVASS